MFLGISFIQMLCETLSNVTFSLHMYRDENQTSFFVLFLQFVKEVLAVRNELISSIVDSPQEIVFVDENSLFFTRAENKVNGVNSTL